MNNAKWQVKFIRVLLFVVYCIDVWLNVRLICLVFGSKRAVEFSVIFAKLSAICKRITD